MEHCMESFKCNGIKSCKLALFVRNRLKFKILLESYLWSTFTFIVWKITAWIFSYKYLYLSSMK